MTMAIIYQDVSLATSDIILKAMLGFETKQQQQTNVFWRYDENKKKHNIFFFLMCYVTTLTLINIFYIIDFLIF